MKLSFVTILVLSGTLSVLPSACKKDRSGSKQPDIYLAGATVNTNGKEVAVYWKNGVATKLSAELDDNSAALGIAANGSDVYVVGNFQYRGGAYWKNGVPVFLGRRTSARAIAVSGSDVYIAGEDSIGAFYRKNDVVQYLPGARNLFDCKSCLAVQGNDVYVTAGEGYWKNGIRVQLPNAPTGTSTSCIVVVGSDVYVGGAEDKASDLSYWKNGVVTTFSKSYSSPSVVPTGIAVSGNNVYLSGSTYTANRVSAAAYWKNNQLYQLPSQNYPAETYGIAVSGDDIYVAGGLGGAFYWKNGVLTTVDASAFGAYGIYVIPR